MKAVANHRRRYIAGSAVYLAFVLTLAGGTARSAQLSLNLDKRLWHPQHHKFEGIELPHGVQRIEGGKEYYTFAIDNLKLRLYSKHQIELTDDAGDGEGRLSLHPQLRFNLLWPVNRRLLIDSDLSVGYQWRPIGPGKDRWTIRDTGELGTTVKGYFVASDNTVFTLADSLGWAGVDLITLDPDLRDEIYIMSNRVQLEYAQMLREHLFYRQILYHIDSWPNSPEDVGYQHSMVNGFSTVLSWYVNKHFTVSPRFIGGWSRYYGRSRSHTRSFSQILRLRYIRDQTVGYTLRIGQKTLNSNDFTKQSSFFVRATAAGTITEHTGHTLQVSLGGVTTENLLAGEDYRTDRWALNYGLGSEMNESLFLRAKIGTKRTRFQTAEEDTSEYYASAGFDYRLAPATLLNGTYRHTWYPRSADREKLHRNTFFLEIEHRF